jgi:hypothetical protein
MADADIVLQSIKEVLRLDHILQEERRKLKVLETEYEKHRDILKQHYGENTLIKTSNGNILIRERIYDGKLSMEDLRDIMDEIDWIGIDTKERLLDMFTDHCSKNKRTARMLTIRRNRPKRKKTIKQRRHPLDDGNPAPSGSTV